MEGWFWFDTKSLQWFTDEWTGNVGLTEIANPPMT